MANLVVFIDILPVLRALYNMQLGSDSFVLAGLLVHRPTPHLSSRNTLSRSFFPAQQVSRKNENDTGVGIAAQFLSALSRLANASSLLDFSSKSSRSSKKKKLKHQIISRLTTEAKYTRSPSTPSNP